MKMEWYRLIDRQVIMVLLVFTDGFELRLPFDEAELYGRRRDIVQAIGERVEREVRDGTARGKRRWDEAAEFDLTGFLTQVSSW
jgi:hypothetical protein